MEFACVYVEFVYVYVKAILSFSYQIIGKLNFSLNTLPNASDVTKLIVFKSILCIY